MPSTHNGREYLSQEILNFCQNEGVPIKDVHSVYAIKSRHKDF